MQADATVLFTRDGYILQVVVNPQIEKSLPSDEFVSIARFSAFLLISGESRVTNAKIRGYYAVILSIGHIGCVILYRSPLTIDALQYVLVQTVLILSVVHHYSGASILSISEYIEYFNAQQEQKTTAAKCANSSDTLPGLGAVQPVQGSALSFRRFYASQPIYPKVWKHFSHESLDYFVRLSFIVLFVHPYSARNLLCLKVLHDKELLAINSAMCLGLIYVVLPHSVSRQGCILRTVGEKLKWVLQQSPDLANEIAYLCCLTSQCSWYSQSKEAEEDGSLAASAAYVCASYQLVVQPCNFAFTSVSGDHQASNLPVSSFYICLAALLSRESLRSTQPLEHVTDVSVRLQFTPFETHKQLFQLVTAICRPFQEECRNIKSRPGAGRPPVPGVPGAAIPTHPPFFAKKAVLGSISFDVSKLPRSRTLNLSAGLDGTSSRTSVVGTSDSSQSTGANV